MITSLSVRRVPNLDKVSISVIVEKESESCSFLSKRVGVRLTKK